jgi:hypothetical protein
LEALLEQRFGLSQVVIAEAARDTEEAVLNAIGSAAAQLLETMLKSGEVIGISSWSASLLSMVNQMHPVRLRFYDANGREIKGPLGNRVSRFLKSVFGWFLTRKRGSCWLRPAASHGFSHAFCLLGVWLGYQIGTPFPYLITNINCYAARSPKSSDGNFFGRRLAVEFLWPLRGFRA